MMVLSVLVVACAPQQIPSDRFYRITLETGPTPRSSSVSKGGIIVDRPEADGLMAGRAITFVAPDTPRTLQAFSYHFWASPPAVMIQDQLVLCLRAGKVADEIITPELRVETHYTLLSRLRRIELNQGSPQRAVLSLDIGLRDDDRNELVMWQTFDADAIADDESVDAAADAFSDAFSAICAQLVARLSEAGKAS